MPLNSFGADQWKSEVYQGLNRLDVSKMLAFIEGEEHKFLDHIGFSAQGGQLVEDTEIRWINDQLNPVTFTAAHTYADDAGDDLVISAPNTVANIKKILRSGSIIQPIGADLGSHYLYQVDDQTISSTTITITGYGNRAKGSSVTSQLWKVISNPHQETGSSSDDISRDRTLSKNYIHLFERAVDLTSVAKVVKQYGIPSVLKYQIESRSKEIKREMNIAALSSYAAYTGGAYVGHVARPTMKGVRQFVSDYGDTDTYKDASAVAITPTLINNLIRSMYDNDGMSGDHFILVPPFQQEQLSSFDEEFVRLERTDKSRGTYANRFLSRLLGKELPVILDKHMPDDSIAILDKSRLTMKHLNDNQLRIMKLDGSTTLFGEKWQLGGIYTLEIRNAGQSHSWMYNLTTS
jgi:hypothetical protein